MSGVWACIYKDMLLSIRQGNGCNGKSIAKPVLLLAIIQVISLKRLCHNRILWNDTCLREEYERLLRCYGEQNEIPLIVPYYHLASAPFYHLIWQNENRPPIKGHTSSAKYLRENLLYAKLDDELWDLLQDAENREYLKRSIIERYLTEKL